jgi:hypothetical protein
MDDPFITDEARLILIDIRGTTNKLCRAFSKREYQLLLADKAYKTPSPDFARFNESIETLEKLYEAYMTTPLEEVITVRA